MNHPHANVLTFKPEVRGSSTGFGLITTMSTTITPERRETYHVLKAYWAEHISWVPAPYQFFIWLSLYNLDALKEATRCSARWLGRQKDKGHPITDTDELVRYFSATARNIHQNMLLAAEVDAEELDIEAEL
jgi:hypothetical protein